MLKKKLKIINISGLHLRPTGLLCNEAIKYRCEISLYSRNSQINAKSVLSVLGACIKCGDEIELVCSGPDEAEAMDAITALIENGLGE